MKPTFQEGFRPRIAQPGIYSVEVKVESLPLAPDMYQLDIGCRSGDTHLLDYIPQVMQVEIAAGRRTPGHIVSRGAGVRLVSDWTWQHLDEKLSDA